MAVIRNSSGREKLYAFSDIQMLTGTLNASGTSTDLGELPDGYTIDNTVVIDCQIYYSSNYRSLGGGISSTTSRAFATISETKLGIYVSDTNLRGNKYKLIIAHL